MVQGGQHCTTASEKQSHNVPVRTLDKPLAHNFHATPADSMRLSASCSLLKLITLLSLVPVFLPGGTMGHRFLRESFSQTPIVFNIADICLLQTIIECLKNACTGELPPNARSGHTFVHDPKVSDATPNALLLCQPHD